MKEYLLSCFFLIFANISTTQIAKIYDWAIVGAGASGIIANGILIDLGVEPENIIWFDPEFNVGRIGKFYQNVPGNSRAQEMSALIKSCKVFSSCASESINLLHAYSPYAEFYLKLIADPLANITHYLITLQITPVMQEVRQLHYNNEFWQIKTLDQSFDAKHVILAIGAEPQQLDYQGPINIPLDIALDKDKLANHIDNNDTIAVIGSGASAILLLKYLSELPIKQVINFYKYHHTQARKKSLIRGQVAEWIKAVLDKDPPKNLLRLLNTTENRNEYLPQCNKIIYATGYKTANLPTISGAQIAVPVPNKTGIIGPRIFGFGFAFPEELTYMSEQGLIKVPLVGLSSFMNFGKRVIPQWLNS